MHAYNLLFGDDPTALRLDPARDETTEATAPVRAGWCAGPGPAIPTHQ